MNNSLPPETSHHQPSSDQLLVWARELGFSALGITDTNLSAYEPALADWLAKGFHGTMDYMARHGRLRSHPDELVPGTLRVISLLMPYWPAAAGLDTSRQGIVGEGREGHSESAYISRYALGRDYHKVLRQRLQRLAERIASESSHQYRVFTDSAPVMEVALAARARLGWVGKHSLLLTRQGSLFFIGEIFTSLPLSPTGTDETVAFQHCGRCTRCIDDCPTAAIIAPGVVDARRCISYLTIEYDGPLPLELRPLLGNRIYGCDDCQLVCPWNRHAPVSHEADFQPRHGLDSASLIALFAWSEQDFTQRMAGSPIYRIGYERWLRNIAVALGNALRLSNDDAAIVAALQARLVDATPLVAEHIHWALSQGGDTSGHTPPNPAGRPAC